MSERGGYDPSRDPNATPNVAGAYFDSEAGCWMMPPQNVPSHPEHPTYLPVVAADKGPGLVIRKVHEERIEVDGKHLPDLMNLFAGLFQSGTAPQQPTQHAPDSTMNVPHVEQVPLEGYAGWDRPPENGLTIDGDLYDTNTDSKLAATRTLAAESESPATKEKINRRAVKLVGKVAIGLSAAQLLVWAGALAAGPEHPDVPLYHYTNPVHDIKNFKNWGPVKLATSVGGLIPR